MLFTKKPAAAKAAPAPQPVASSTSTKAASPYLNARREWDERYGDLMTRARNWQIAAVIALALAAMSTAGVVWIGSQSKIQPFIIAVDSLGSPVAVARPQALARGAQMDERVVRAQLANFIFNSRSLLRDFEAQQMLLDRTFAMLSGDVAPTMTAFQRDVRIPAQQKGVTIAIEIRTVLQVSPNTWQIDWMETVNEPGASAVREQWRALVTVGVDEKLATNPELSHWNPLGIFVRQINWQKVSV
jgi:type IV secretion system protein VirB5